MAGEGVATGGIRVQAKARAQESGPSPYDEDLRVCVNRSQSFEGR